MTDKNSKEHREKPEFQGAPKCGAKVKNGPRKGEGCLKSAGWGTPHRGFGACKGHGGGVPNHMKAANKEKARREVATYGLPREIDPADALIEEVCRAAGHVSWISDRIRELEQSELIWGVTEEVDQGATEFPGINRKHAAVPHVWLDLYNRERKHLVDVCKATIAAGVAERQVKLAERMGGQLAQVMQGIFRRMGMDPNDPALLAAITAEFGSLVVAGQSGGS